MAERLPCESLFSSSNSVITIPRIGFGTAVYAPAESNAIKSAILNAIEVGYRHFDSAAFYQYAEKPLGEAIAEALRRGLVNSRDELFITSKLWCCDAHHDRVQPALKATLKNLGLDYLDLYAIHWPVSSKEPGEYTMPMKKENLQALDMKLTWEAMEECQKLGLTKSIGVSNFSTKKLSDLLSVAKSIPPAVIQVEMNPLWQQQKMREFCKSKAIQIIAYSPLGAKGTLWGNNVMDCPLLKEIAQAKGKTVAQVCLRWAYEQGVNFIVKSFNKDRMKSNLEILDWELSQEELEKISKIGPQVKGNRGEEFVSETGPFHSLEELWDGEI